VDSGLGELTSSRAQFGDEIDWVNRSDRPGRPKVDILDLVLTSEGPLLVSAVTGTTGLLDLYGLSPEARSALQSQGAIFVRDLSDGMPLQPTPGLPTLSVSADSPAVPIGVFAMGGFSDSFDHLVVTQQFIDDLDLTTAGGPLFAVRDDPFDRSELQRLRSALTDVSGSESQVFLAAPPIERSLQIISPNPAQPDRSVIYRGWTSVLVMLLVLLVVAFGLALGLQRDVTRTGCWLRSEPRRARSAE